MRSSNSPYDRSGFQAGAAQKDPKCIEATADLIAAGQMFYKQGWVFGTSGNLSTVISRDPVQLAITRSGVHKGALSAEDFLQVNEHGEALEGDQRPSAETGIHLAIISECEAGAVLHTHSIWATLLSEWHAASGGITIHGYEMLKGLRQVETHEHQEWVPILENSQDYPALSRLVAQTIRNNLGIHGILLRRHGLYTWGRDVGEARRHVEILEFLFEVLGRQCTRVTL